MHLRIARQQIKTVRIPARRQVQVNVVAQGSGGHHLVVLVLDAKLFKGLEGFAVDNRPLFNPADLLLLGSHLEEAAAVLEHFERLAVADLGHAIGNGGYAVVQIRLPRIDVDRVVALAAQTVASR